MAEFDRILVVRGGAIGDFVLTLPVFAALRENFPASPPILLHPVILSKIFFSYSPEYAKIVFYFTVYIKDN